MYIRYVNGSIALRELLAEMALGLGDDNLLRQAVRRGEIVKAASGMGVDVPAEQVQQFADNFRLERGLSLAADMRSYLHRWGLSEADFARFCESCLLEQALAERLAPPDKVKEYFLAHPFEFDQARISQIVVQDREAANELAMRIREDQEDFHALARQCSLDQETRHAGGYLGLVRRKDLPPAVADKVFTASPGQTLGPFPLGQEMVLIHVEELLQGELNDELARDIRRRFLDEWGESFLGGGLRVEHCDSTH